jgi:hypothetical protein
MKYIHQRTIFGQSHLYTRSFFLLSYLGLAKILFERCAESKYSAEKSTLACASRRCCFQNERLDEIDKEFGVGNYLVVPAAYDPVEWGWELTGFSIGTCV